MNAQSSHLGIFACTVLSQNDTIHLRKVKLKYMNRSINHEMSNTQSLSLHYYCIICIKQKVSHFAYY